MIPTVWDYAETFSTLLRKRDDNRLDVPTFNAAVTSLRRGVITSPDTGFLAIDGSAVLAGLSLMERHNINATDAALLASLSRYARTPPWTACSCRRPPSERTSLLASQGLP